MSGKHVGFYDVFLVDTGVYFAHPRNRWAVKFYVTEWEEFYFSKIGKFWKADPHQWSDTAVEITGQLGLKN